MKNAVVTGGTKGIGRAICELLLEQGFAVYTTARNVDGQFAHPQLHQFGCDLSQKEGVLEFGDWVNGRVDHLDILVNNVGIFIPGSILEEEDLVFEQQINTNLAPTYHLTRKLIDVIKKGERPYIFNICSTASITAYTNGGSYCISKYAQLGLTKVLREELKKDKVAVSAVLPGATYTDSWQGSGLPEDRFINPKSIAQLIWTAYKLDPSTVMEEILVRPMEGDI
jgi:NAD(P)-dependent dehydrogenase (short-subunit alcohol dehydrogenase family)